MKDQTKERYIFHVQMAMGKTVRERCGAQMNNTKANYISSNYRLIRKQPDPGDGLVGQVED